MTLPQHAATPGTPGEAAPAADRRVFIRYVMWTLPIPLLVWAMAFFLVTSKSFERWGQTEWGPVLEFPFQLGTPDADVVIFGDSSAFLGIDPKLLNAELGIHSVVLPGTVGSLPVIGDAALRNYLAHHKRPALIVLYFSPWNLDFDHMAQARRFEGEEMMFRHGTAGQIVRYELRHPLGFLVFPLRLYSTFGSRMIVQILHHEDRVQDTAASLGHAPFLQAYPPLENRCRIPSEYMEAKGMQTVQALRTRYIAEGWPVMMYMAPVPNCTNASALQDRSFNAIDAAPPRTLPPTYFAGDRYYAHILPAAVPFSTKALAQALAGRLRHVAPQLVAPLPDHANPQGSESAKSAPAVQR